MRYVKGFDTPPSLVWLPGSAPYSITCNVVTPCWHYPFKSVESRQTKARVTMVIAIEFWIHVNYLVEGVPFIVICLTKNNLVDQLHISKVSAEHQSIQWTNDGLLSTRSLRTYFAYMCVHKYKVWIDNTFDCMGLNLPGVRLNFENKSWKLPPSSYSMLKWTQDQIEIFEISL